MNPTKRDRERLAKAKESFGRELSSPPCGDADAHDHSLAFMGKCYECERINSAILGIDPGINGGFAWLRHGVGLNTKVMPVMKVGKHSQIDVKELIRFLQAIKPVKMAWLEQVHSMPRQGVRSMFTFGEGFGILKGALTACDIPFTLVTPQKWQAEIIGKRKGEENAIARELFPAEDFLATDRCKVPHSGKVDAALIAEYGRRQG